MMLAVNMDEMGLMVKVIDKRCFIIFVNIGGFAPRILLKQKEKF